jgi:PAS domain S-box-containing protein
MKVDAKKKPAWFMLTDRCPYSGLPITHAETFVCSDPKNDFRAEIAKFGDNIFFVKSYGYVTTEAQSESLEHLDRYIAAHFENERSLIYIEDYGSLTGGDAGSRKKYISYFKNNPFLLACILFNIPPVYKISFDLFKKLNIYSSRAHAVYSFEDAMVLALKMIDRDFPALKAGNEAVFARDMTNHPKASRQASGFIGRFDRMMEKLKNGEFFLTEGARRRLSAKYAEQMIQYIASIDWQTPGIQPLEKHIVPDDVSSRKLFDAITFVKSEIDDLMEERAIAAAVLRENETKYRLLVQHAKVGILEYDFNRQRILNVNDEVVRYSGYSREELLEINPLDLLTEESRKLYQDRLARIMSGQNVPQNVVYQSVSKDKNTLWWILNSDIIGREGRPDKGNIVITDITELKESERRLLEYQDKLKRLSIRLSMVEEGQRRSLASHLHETIGQELFVMQLQLKALEKTVDKPALLTSLQQIHTQLLKIIKETKDLTFDLSPPVLYDLGLKEAVEALSANMASKHNIGVKTHFEGEMDEINDEIKAIIYRNVKELMHNTVKHADAKNIQIRLVNSPGRLYVDFHDDGVGLDAAKAGSAYHNGFGLFDIREKLNHLGGHLTIDAIPGEGTDIYMEVPLDIGEKREQIIMEADIIQ